MPMVRMSLVLDTGTERITVTPSTDLAQVSDDGQAWVAALDWQRWARLAVCVTSCLAAPAREQANAAAPEKGGAHQTPPAKK